MPRSTDTADTEAVRRRLYQVTAESHEPLAVVQERVLDIVCEALGVESGYVVRSDGVADAAEIEASASGGERGACGSPVVAPGATYCGQTLSARRVVAWCDDARGTDAPGCYIGTPLSVEASGDAIVCFASETPRGVPFDAAEKALVELAARLLGQEMADDDGRAETHRRAEEYDSLLEAAPDAVFLVEAATGAIVRANAVAAELTGYDRATLTEMTALNLHPPGERDELWSADDGIANADTPQGQTSDGRRLRLHRADGTEIPVELGISEVEVGGTRYYQCIIRDVSERLERERELQVRTRAVEAASVGITIADATRDDLPLIYANDEFEQLTGYDRSEVLGENCRFLQGPETDEATVERVRRALDEEVPVSSDILNYRVDGTPFWNELTLAPVTDDDGETSHFVGFQRDITGRKRRTRLVGVLNRILRHNIRNAMTVIRGNAEMLRDTDDERTTEMADSIVDRATELVELGEKARELEAVMEHHSAPTTRNVAADVASVTEDLGQAYPEAELCVEGLDSCEVAAPGHLRMALRELGENAVKHGGPEPTVTFRLDRGDETVTVAVADDGPGLSEGDQRVLQTGRESQLNHGQGIGLWLVNWIVTSVGGQVSVSVDDGTTVRIELPTGEGDDRPGSSRAAALGLGPE